MSNASRILIYAAAFNCLSLGCSSNSDRLEDSKLASQIVTDGEVEPSWADQVALVRNGKTASIRILDRSVASGELKQLKQLSGLRELVLDQGVVQDADIVHDFVGFSLEHLRLRRSPLTDSSGIFLARHHLQLRIVNVPSAIWTVDSIREISKLPKLTHLRLGGPSINDACVEAIAQSQSLRSLHLIGPSLTDAALRHIGPMQSLQSFYLDDCDLSAAAWEELFAEHPTLHVHIDQAHHDRDPSNHRH